VSAAQEDVAAAAALIAAVSAGGDSWVPIINAARVEDRLTRLCLATAAQCASIASEYYDTDRQMMLDMRAMDAMAELGDE
jgi:hypothetical protein